MMRRLLRLLHALFHPARGRALERGGEAAHAGRAFGGNVGAQDNVQA
jgi:hypothetical protein